MRFKTNTKKGNKAIKKLGIKVYFKREFCEIHGKGVEGYKYKKNLIINAQNSGTLGRLILGLIINTPHTVKLIGDKSLSKRDFSRVTDPLNKSGAKFFNKKNGNIPLSILGHKNPKIINYFENRGSAQCKSSVMLAALNTVGKTMIKAKKSRNHSELLFKYLNIPIKIKKNKNYDFIELKRPKKIKPFNYKIPGDISSSAFFMVLTRSLDPTLDNLLCNNPKSSSLLIINSS